MKQILISTSLLSALALLIFSVSDSEKQSYISIDDRAVEEQSQGFKGAHEYMMSLKADPATGEIPLDLVLNAKQEVNDVLRTRSAAATSLFWSEMGPDNAGGRTRAILIDKDNTDKIFAGGVSGGLWLSMDAGLHWNIIEGTDALDFSGVVSICQASNGDIYFGTGEGSTLGSFGGNSNGSSGIIGGGIYKSTDGGQNFEHLEATIPTANFTNTGAEFASVTELAANNTDPNIIYAATSNGLKITTDGGQTWANAITGSATFFDVEVASDGSVFASTSNRIYYSEDGSEGSYDIIPSSVTFGGGTGRIEIEIAPSDPNYIYAIFSNVGGLGRYKGIFRSKDKGQTWDEIIPGWAGSVAPLNNIFNEQANYAMALAVDPSDKDRIIIGGLDLWVWKDGDGVEPKSYWAAPDVFSWAVHADQHEIVFHPDNHDIVYFGNDGGVYRSLDGGENYNAINRGYSVTQFYTVGFSKEGYIIGGTQDNGTQLINFESQFSAQAAVEVRGGDGGFALISHFDSDIMFAESQNGSASRSANGGESFGSLENLVGDTIAGLAQTASDSNNDGLFATFINPMELWESVNVDGSPKDTSFFFAATSLISGGTGSDFCVYMTKEALDFGTVPEWFQVTTSGGSPVTRMSVSPDGNHLYFARGSSLFRTDNLNLDTVSNNYSNMDIEGATSVVNTISVPTPTGNTITSIAFDPNDANTIVLTLGNYNNVDHVYRSINALDSIPDFNSIQGNLPKMPVYSAVIDVNNSNNIIIGTEFGIWSTLNGSSWQSENDGMPLIPCHMLRQQTLPGVNKGVIYVGTHGRGFFKSSNTSSIIEQASNNDSDSEFLDLKLFPNPTSSILNIESNFTNYNFEIVDLMGKRVFSSNSSISNSKVDVSSFEVGTYIVITNGLQGKEYGQFIKTN
tara:strand:+ start:6077 stop:8800 length:2724 start_codon:yes stop_codon:yes gene_type:complete